MTIRKLTASCMKLGASGLETATQQRLGTHMVIGRCPMYLSAIIQLCDLIVSDNNFWLCRKGVMIDKVYECELPSPIANDLLPTSLAKT